MTEKRELFGGTIRFKELMKDVVDRIEELSNLVEKMIDASIIAFKHDNENIFEDLQSQLTDVHEIQEELEKSIANSITLHQPFAKDIRFLVSSIKISNEIHRCAHDAIHIARTTKFYDSSMTIFEEPIEKIINLSKMAYSMFTKSTEAFINQIAMDIDEWMKLDDEVDDYHNEIIANISKIMNEECENIKAGISFVLTTRYIERIADHACNIVEESTYVVTSKRVKIE
jgi:phosphate transport system protein